MQSGVNWDSDPLILMPIFIGSTNGGHFSLLVIDRTQNKDGNFVYFDSLPTEFYGKQTAEELKQELPKMPFWREGSVFFSQVGKGESQGLGTNDCGIMTCLYAASYFLGLQRSNIFEREGLADQGSTFAIAWEMASKDKMPKLGRYGRSHIEETLRSDELDFTHKVLSKGLRLSLMYY